MIRDPEKIIPDPVFWGGKALDCGHWIKFYTSDLFT
jgi:hypothetical protein